MNNGTTFYNSSSQWAQQPPTNGFGTAPNFTRSSFGSPGYDNGFNANGFGSSNGTAQYSQQFNDDTNGFSNNNMNGYSQPKSSGFGASASRADSYNKPQEDWSKQAATCESQEKDLFESVNSGINFDKYDDIPVQVSGSEAPVPIDTFDAARFHEFIQENVRKTGYTKPTPVQKHSIPTLLANRDLMSCAQTGSGKTAAFLLPIIHHILTNGPDAVKPSNMNPQGRRCFYPSALVLSPTRELAIQIHKEACKFSYRTNLVTAILYGGRENYRDQINKLRGGCNILIATPGRLIDIIEQGYIGLAGCRYLVLDEADRMLDMGFEPQIRKIVQSGHMPDKSNRITAMFSATFPAAIQKLAQDFLKPNYIFLAVGRVGSTSENIEQEVLFVEEYDKKKALLDLLAKDDPNSLVLIFVETKRGANELTYYLQRQQLRAVAIHGDLKQYERERNLAVFRSGQYPILVATAVAARGLDIPNVKHVVNNDLPSDIDEYVHRIGRTGRCGNLGRATSFFNDKNRGIAKDLMQLMGEANKEIPDWLQRAAAEGRVMSSNRSNRGRFGGTDFRRGGAASRGGGYSSNSSVYPTPQSNSYGGYSNGSSGFGGGYTGNSYGGNFGGNQGAYSGNSGGFSSSRPPTGYNGFSNSSNGFANSSNGFSNSSNGFGSSNGGFNNPRMVSYPVSGFNQAPPQNYGSYGNGYPQQGGFDSWQ